ncbi:hypothetical protein [Thermococcus sp. AM4]|uniref:hypothetical protein n=1 Tax=Thermococcus sp. (strain AM4) TaxID=246969 RepID=UPI00018706F7|nr:hypothetical protein [Thermococcus sp. AM4]EEB74350.1 conserved hypothetical protein [Thermococcus sp. AM4]
MLVRGKVVGKNGIAHFEVRKEKGGLTLRAEFPDGEPLDYSVDCPCLEPLELVGLLLPAFEERLGEIEGVFVEDIEEEKSVLRRIRELLGKIRRKK